MLDTVKLAAQVRKYATTVETNDLQASDRLCREHIDDGLNKLLEYCLLLRFQPSLRWQKEYRSAKQHSR